MISRTDVEHIARLARIELTESEREKFQRELSSILEFVAKLGEVDTSNVEPLAGGTDLEHVMREDGTEKQEARSMKNELVEAAPRKREGYVEVEAVFEERAG